MVHLDTQDMEKHRVELRVLLDRHRRRFNNAKQQHTFEEIVKAELNKNQAADETDQSNTIRLESIDPDGVKLLARFLDNLINRGEQRQQHELLQQTLRAALQNSRRQSILVHSVNQGMAGPLEPFCLFCASDLPNQQPTQQPMTGQQVFFPGDATACPPLSGSPADGQPLVTNHQVIPSIKFVTNHQQITPPNSAAPTPDVGHTTDLNFQPRDAYDHEQPSQHQQEIHRSPTNFPVGQMDIPFNLNERQHSPVSQQTVGKQPIKKLGRPPKTTLEAVSGAPSGSAGVQMKMNQTSKKQTNASELKLAAAASTPPTRHDIHPYARPVQLMGFHVVPPSSSDSDDHQGRISPIVRPSDHDSDHEDIDVLNDDDYRIDSVKNHLDDFHEAMMEPMASSTIMMTDNHDDDQTRRRSSTPLSDAPTDPDIALVIDESCRTANLSQISSVSAEAPPPDQLRQQPESNPNCLKSSSEFEYSQASSRPPSRSGNKSLDQVATRLLQQAAHKKIDHKQTTHARHSTVKLISQPVQSVIIKQKILPPKTNATPATTTRSQQQQPSASEVNRVSSTFSQPPPTGGIKTKQTVKRRNKRRY